MNVKIEALKKECAQSKISMREAEEKIEALQTELRQVKLGQDDVKILRKRLFEAKRPLEDKEKERLDKEREEAAQQQKRKQDSIRTLLEQIQEVLDQAEILPLETIVEKWEILVKQEKGLGSIGIERALLKAHLDSIFDHIQEKRWHDLQQKQPADLSSQLHCLLDERHKARRKLKETLDEHRKMVGGSALSLDESMRYQELIREDKIRLDSIETTIEEIEEKLFDLEG